jgi:hypothetical protein
LLRTGFTSLFLAVPYCPRDFLLFALPSDEVILSVIECNYVRCLY